MRMGKLFGPEVFLISLIKSFRFAEMDRTPVTPSLNFMNQRSTLAVYSPSLPVSSVLRNMSSPLGSMSPTTSTQVQARKRRRGVSAFQLMDKSVRAFGDLMRDFFFFFFSCAHILKINNKCCLSSDHRETAP